jgi:DNA polymerase
VGVDWYLPSTPPPPGEAKGAAGALPPARPAAGGSAAGPPATPEGEAPGPGAKVPAPSLAEAARLAASATTLDELRESLLACRACPLCAGATNLVFGTGDPKARLLFVGEGPGEEEDRQGEPFVGRAGKLLDRWIARLGLARGDVYIANVVKCRPPANRAPSPEEAAACLPWLRAQVRILRPEVVCTLGNTPLRHFLGVAEGITRARGKWLEHEGIAVLPTYHPAYILRNARAEGEVFADFDLLRARLGL